MCRLDPGRRGHRHRRRPLWLMRSTASAAPRTRRVSEGCCTRTSLTQKCQDIVDGIQKMDALERAAHHEFETAVRGASGAERQQSLCTLRGVRRLAADGAQVVAALSGAWSAWPGRAKPAARF